MQNCITQFIQVSSTYSLVYGRSIFLFIKFFFIYLPRFTQQFQISTKATRQVYCQTRKMAIVPMPTSSHTRWIDFYRPKALPAFRLLSLPRTILKIRSPS